MLPAAFRRSLPVPADAGFRAGDSSVAATARAAGALAVDLTLCAASLSLGAGLVAAHLAGFAGAVAAFCLTQRGTPRRLAALVSFALPILFLRGGLLALLTRSAALPAQVALAAVAVPSSLGLWAVAGWLDRGLRADSAAFARLVVLYSVALRLLYVSSAGLIHEEAYYWGYARRLDLGYIDHPPLVGWIIGTFTTLLGDTEFAVRIGALLCWCVTAYYVHKLTRAILGREIAVRAVLLVALLPGFYVFGTVMTPDTPLIAAWSAALYWLHRAIVEERPRAWLGAGAAIGVGLMSKYTIALLGLAAVAFVLGERRARAWLRRPQPYIGAAIALLCFSPNVLWNARHGWVSFEYQTLDRLRAGFEFSSPELIGSALLLLTPTALLAFGAVLRCRRDWPGRFISSPLRRSYGLLLVSCGAPLAVFAGFSVFRRVCVDWTAPVWLALVPWIAATMLPGNPVTARFPRLSRVWWPATVAALVVLYGAAAHYLVLGLPGLPYPSAHARFPVGEEDLARQVERLVETRSRSDGYRPLVVTLDTDQIAGWVDFYGARARHGDVPSLRASGGHFFGYDSGMYRLWFPSQDETGRTLLLLTDRRERLEVLDPKRKEPLGPIREFEVHANGRSAGHWFYRFLERYSGPKPQARHG